MARQCTVVPRSGRRGRRFKSCHPDHSRRSLTCGNAVSCARCPAPQRSPQRPRGNKKEHEGTKRKDGAEFDGQKNTRPLSTIWQTPGHCRVLQGTVIPRPQRRGRWVETPAGQESLPIQSRQTRLAQDRRRAPLDGGAGRPSALNSTIECAQMTRAETSGVREGSSAGPVPVIHNDGRLGIGTVWVAVP
jgi:hypothetical protein